jgi:hypothetical protein
MALVVPSLDLTARTLTLTVRSKPGSKDAEDSTPLVVALDSDLGLDLDTLMSTTAETTTKGSSQTSVTTTVHGSRRGACRSNARVSDWFTEVLGCACHLVCSDAGGGGDAGRVVDKKEIGNFSNEGSCLLVSEESVESVRRRSESMNLQKKGSGTCLSDFHCLPRFAPKAPLVKERTTSHEFYVFPVQVSKWLLCRP